MPGPCRANVSAPHLALPDESQATSPGPSPQRGFVTSLAAPAVTRLAAPHGTASRQATAAATHAAGSGAVCPLTPPPPHPPTPSTHPEGSSQTYRDAGLTPEAGSTAAVPTAAAGTKAGIAEHAQRARCCAVPPPLDAATWATSRLHAWWCPACRACRWSYKARSAASCPPLVQLPCHACARATHGHTRVINIYLGWAGLGWVGLGWAGLVPKVNGIMGWSPTAPLATRVHVCTCRLP